MDSEHRHELQENWLANKLVAGFEKIQPHLPVIVLAIGGLLVGTMAWNSWRGSAATSEELAWGSYSIALNLPSSAQIQVGELERVSQDFKGSSVVPWADSARADAQLLLASRTLLTNREEALKLLSDAELGFEQLNGNTKVPAELRNRARFGLARVQEMRGESEAAVEWYGKVEGAFADLAEARSKQLEDEQAREDLQWLASAEASIGLPPSYGAGLDLPPATPDALDLPLAETTPDAEAADDTTQEEANFEDVLGGLSLGKADEETPTEETPTEESSAEQSSAEESPAEESPAEESPAAAENEPSEQEASSPEADQASDSSPEESAPKAPSDDE